MPLGPIFDAEKKNLLAGPPKKTASNFCDLFQFTLSLIFTRPAAIWPFFVVFCFSTHTVHTVVQEPARTAPPQSLLYHQPSMWCTVLERLGSPFSTILYGSLQLWERISLWQCREYQGRPYEALLCKMFGAVFIPDGIV